jgi:hypothetical protein
MANVEFTAFVNSILRNKDGQAWLLKTAEPHRRETVKGNGEWETTARTFRDVTLSNDADPDMFESLHDGDRIVVKGFELTKHTSRGEQDFYNLTVYAYSAELVVADDAPKAARKPVANARRR